MTAVINSAAGVRVGIGVFVCRGGRFLMGRRRGAHGAGTWSVPGGHLEFGESFEDTAVREVAEETGVQIGNVRFGAVTNDVFPGEGRHYVTVWMLSDHVAGEPAILEPDKCTDLAWHDFDDLPEPLFLPWRQLVRSPHFDAIRRELSAAR
ncbi:NUDIX domain-containing protein [Dactylosporangium aurantiacum]|uniref:NUDIX domain-containing protein n=1 Tax=Dactylosporangium aurantiacum TaxID=35754 RepID=A0A9Q9MK65_9ACTN|nr:NUDIX domain-containing protein [Dactylosporangium aurantiacum]